jgi:hypothetical protein
MLLLYQTNLPPATTFLRRIEDCPLLSVSRRKLSNASGVVNAKVGAVLWLHIIKPLTLGGFILFAQLEQITSPKDILSVST